MVVSYNVRVGPEKYVVSECTSCPWTFIGSSKQTDEKAMEHVEETL